MLTTIIRTKNNENTISEVLESVKDLGEIIVLDEHSDDDTILISKEYKAHIIYTSALDFMQTFNQAISGAQNEWILFLEGDEIIPDKLGQDILNYIEKPKKNKNVILLAQKLFYPDKEIKAERKICLKVFKKECAQLINNYSTKLKPIKTKKAKIYYGFKKNTSCILKFEKRNIFAVLKELIEKNIIKSKEENKKSTSLFIKPLFIFINHYIIKGGIFDGKRGLIYSILKTIDCCILEINNYENIKKA